MAIEVRTTELLKQYLRIRYFGYTHDNYAGKITHTISYGDKLTDKPHEIIRPPVARGKYTFLFDKGGNTLSSDLFYSESENVEIIISENFNFAFLCNFIEYIYYLHLINIGKTVIHCSAFQVDNCNFIFPAGRNTGKTNVLLESLDDGAKYLADDWLIYGPNGDLEIFPKAINIQSYNVEALRGFKRLMPFFTSFQSLDELSSLVPFFSRKKYEEIIAESQLFIPHQHISSINGQALQGSFIKQNFIWLSKQDHEMKVGDICRIDKSSMTNHVLATRKIEHYPFELWRLAAGGFDLIFKKYSENLDLTALQFLNDESVDCYKIFIPSQVDTHLAVNAINNIMFQQRL